MNFIIQFPFCQPLSIIFCFFLQKTIKFSQNSCTYNEMRYQKFEQFLHGHTPLCRTALGEDWGKAHSSPLKTCHAPVRFRVTDFSRESRPKSKTPWISMDLPLEKSTEKARNLVVSGFVGLISILSRLLGGLDNLDTWLIQHKQIQPKGTHPLRRQGAISFRKLLSRSS